jgi:flagellin
MERLTKGTAFGGSGDADVAKKEDMSKLQDQILASLQRMPDFAELQKHIEFAVTPDGLRIELLEIGKTTNFNGVNVFSSNAPTTFTSTQASLTSASALTSGSVTTISDTATGGTFVFKATGSSTVADLTTAVAGAVTAGTLSAGTTATIVGGKVVIGPNTAGSGISATTNDAVLGPMAASGGNSTNTVFISDGVTTGAANTQITTTINSLSSTSLALNASDLNSTSDSQSALSAITAAIASISSQRGALGASVNRLQAATNVMSTQVTNLQSATNSVDNADIGKTVANMTQYNILQSTGEAALQQSNQAQQGVLKLLQ